MRFRTLAFAFACVVCLGGLADSASGEERWAAVDANNDGNLPVVWDATEEGAVGKAVRACKEVSSSCSGGPARTPDINHVFAYMCCTKPRLGCAVGVGDQKKMALAMIRKTFSDAGYSRCTLKQYLSAKTGNRLK